ncbi:sulfatase-like hydrolase/transferase [Fodinibius sp. N2]|uniref:sulfatase-like hydrolase/transferase n=1 Tax=Fodinibius alkaliphilus TaxID=3140241 RepID=UPI00315A6AD6
MCGSNNKIVDISTFVRLLIGLWATVAISRVYEALVGIWYYGIEFVSAGYVSSALVHDFQLTVFLAMVLGALFVALSFTAGKISYNIIAYLAALIILINFLLITYFGATQIPLGAEFWAYSVSEMTNTVLAAERVSLVGWLFYPVVYVICYWIIKKLLVVELFPPQKKNRPLIFGAIVLLAFGGSFFVSVDEEATPAQNDKQTNKLVFFVTKSIASVDWLEGQQFAGDVGEYPLLRDANYEDDTLGPFFEEFDRSPNVVFLLVESLGGEFVGPSGQWTGFAPYLDSLSQQSLYWENGLSLSGRTFGMVPSLLGSLPFGNHGFMELGPNYPGHQSIISILNQRGYYTAFYSGYDTYFDGLDFFLDYQQTDFVLNKEKLRELLPEAARTSNYWGVDDKTMLDFSASLLDTAQAFPRLEIYHTLQSHSPFNVPNSQKYEQEFHKRINELDLSAERRNAFQRYRAELTTLLFADQAVEEFMKSYRRHSEFENTIFVITGDHWLIPVPQTSAISRYHVPIMIYSPKLKEAAHFKSVNTHAEVMPSLLALLDQNTAMQMPGSVHWMGGMMDTARHFRSTQSAPLMRNKNQISDYLYKDHYLYGDELFKLSDGLRLIPQDSSSAKNQLQKKLNEFKSINKYVVEQNRLYRDNSDAKSSPYAFISDYDTLFTRLDSAGLSIDEQFQEARQAAFNGNYEVAEVISKRILLQAPDYHDVRILLGRVNAWQGNYDEAAGYFEEVLQRDPSYADIYNAYFDNEFWQGDHQKALDVINRGLEYHPKDEQLLERKIKILYAMQRKDQAQQLFDDLRQANPDYKGLQELKKYIAE